MDDQYDGTSRRRILQAGALGAGAALVPAVSGALPAMATTSGQGSISGSVSASAAGSVSGSADNPRFTVAVVPDTQYLFDLDRGDPEPLTASFEYLIEQRAADNIVFTAHLGDVVENAQASEFAQAGPVFGVLDRARMPYSVLAGNHDINSRTTSAATRRTCAPSGRSGSGG